MDRRRNKNFNHYASRLCPLLALTFSILVTVTTLYINESLSLPFIYVSIQVYLNWYSIYTISRNATTLRDNTHRTSQNNTVTIRMSPEDESRQTLKYWYCDKCACYTFVPTQHCSACRRCFHFRDHHCFFIGGCVLRQSMGNFIIICLHTSLACFYSAIVIGLSLYDSLVEKMGHESSSSGFFLNFCFPVALVKFIVSGESGSLMLIILFNALVSVCISCFFYGCWKLFCCLTGRQKYYHHVPRRVKIEELFGSYGIANFIFPYNGLLGSRDIEGKYSLKQI